MNDIDTPSDLILARSEAFREADFGFIFDSYHSTSNFRLQFDERDDYVQLGWFSLGKDFKIQRCEIICEELQGEEARVIYLMEMTVHGERQLYAELTWLEQEEGGWRYHRGQKMEEAQLPDDPMKLTFADFDKLEPKIIF